jgi:hypothetical protein
MRSLAEVDRDLDELAIPAARLKEARARAVGAKPASLAAADAELEALAAGTGPITRLSRAESALADDASGMTEVPDEVLRRADLPAVLALEAEPPLRPDRVANAEIAGALSALALDLDSGETPLEMEPEPAADRQISGIKRSTLPPSMEPDALSSGLDDPNADLGALLGEADPLRDIEAASPLHAGFDELEDEHTAMFTAADAERFSRPPPPDASVDGTMGDEVELDIEEVDIEEDELVEAAAGAAPMRAPAGRTQPPPPPRTMPPEPPKGARPSEAPRGFLGKLLQRKP